MASLLQRIKLKFRKPDLPDSIEKPFDSGIVKATTFFDEFKKFALKGNVIELAIGVIIGASFKTVVDSIVNDVVMPLLSIVTGNIDFSNRFINLSGGNFNTLEEAKEAGAVVMTYGNFLNAVINFVLIALIIFIVIRFVIGQKQQEEKKVKTKKCVECLEEIKYKATKCKYCASKQPKLKKTEEVEFVPSE